MAKLRLDCNTVICSRMLASNVDVRISTWMALGHLHGDPFARPRASTTGCGFVDDAAVQAELDHAVVPQQPDPSLWIPRPASLFHPVTDCDVDKGDAQRDDLVVGEARPRRFPIAFGDEDLHGFEPLLPLGIVAIGVRR